VKPPPVIVGETGSGTAAARGWGRGWWLAVPAVAAAAFVLREFEPRGQFFYPQCWLYRLTGLQCPGCGGLRATHALLNGDIVAAWRLNPLAVALVPVAGWVSLALGLRAFRGIELPNPFGQRYAIAVLMGLVVAFGIGRNLRF